MAIIPDSNVNLASNVRDVLNGAGGSVGNGLTSFFTAAAKINKWAKFKPTIYYNQPFLDDDRRWKGNNQLCGFTEGSVLFNDTQSLVDAHKSGNTFVYDIPSGGTAEPMRLGDFRLYKTDAKSPIWSFEYIGQMATNNPSSSSTFKVLGNGDIDDNYNLKLSDLSPRGNAVSGWYFGIIITDSLNIVKNIFQSASGIGTAKNFEATVTVTASQFIAGKYKAYPCFVNPANNKQYLACPVNPVPFEVVTSVDAHQVGWMEKSGFYYPSLSGRFTFQAQIAYNDDFEGTSVRVTPVVIYNNGTEEELGHEIVDLPNITTDRGFVDYSVIVRMTEEDNAQYYLRMLYGSGYGNTKDIRLLRLESAP